MDYILLYVIVLSPVAALGPTCIVKLCSMRWRPAIAALVFGQIIAAAIWWSTKEDRPANFFILISAGFFAMCLTFPIYVFPFAIAFPREPSLKGMTIIIF